MKDFPGGEKPSSEAGPFKLSASPSPMESRMPVRVNYRQQSLAASHQLLRQIASRPPAARPTFRVTLS